MSVKKRSKSPRRSDRFAAREAQKYDNPIPSREYILEHLERRKAPAQYSELAEELQLIDEADLEALRRRLRAMERDGQLLRTRRGAYGLINKLDLIPGKVMGHREGFGFLLPEQGGDDLFLSHRQMQAVFDGDEVLVREAGFNQRGRREAIIVEVVKHNTQTLVGRLYQEGDAYFVKPHSRRNAQRVLVNLEDSPSPVGEPLVEVEITHQPKANQMPQGRLIRIIGEQITPRVEIELAISTHNIPEAWNAEIDQELQQLSDEVSEEDKLKRVDLRDRAFVTIDGEDARDFDDALYCETKKSGGWRLFVAIADVSHYIPLGSALDQEAHQRGNSVYFPDRVIPMLPEKISNGLCSLNPLVDRLCMVCEMTISAQGRISGYQFYEAVMHSQARLTYTKVGAMLQQPESEAGQRWRHEYQPLVPYLEELYKLYKVLHSARQSRGAIDFDTVETRIEFAADGNIADIVPVQRNDAHRIVEECMLCANVATARFLEKHDLVGLYRVHEGPKAEKLTNLQLYLGELGLHLGGGLKPKPENYQQLLQGIAARPDMGVIQTMLLRSLSQAVYSPDNQGHFGLAYPAYTHFTSPIRRYPDLLVHRAIRSVIRSRVESRHVQRVGASRLAKKHIYPYDMPAFLQLGEHCSMTERRADDATRDVLNYLKCEYIKDHVGGVFPGVISSVTAFGLFVELTDIYIEGLVHVTALKNDYYHYDQANQRLVGERTRKKYALGDAISVQVVRVDMEERKIDFELSEEQALGKKTKSRHRSKTTNSSGINSKKNLRRLQQAEDRADQPGKRTKAKGKIKTEGKKDNKAKKTSRTKKKPTETQSSKKTAKAKASKVGKKPKKAKSPPASGAKAGKRSVKTTRKKS